MLLQRNIEKRQLFGMVKMLLAILWHIRVESPKLITDVEESLNVLERLASVSRITSSSNKCVFEPGPN
eukprot:SAG31_NODE_145_length_22612_cov_5.938169_12_plen_68_part_00